MNFDGIRLIIFSFMDYAFGIVSENYFPSSRAQTFSPMFCSKSLIVELIFLYMAWSISQGSFYSLWVSTWALFVEKTTNYCFIKLPLHPSQNSVNHVCVGLFLDFLLSSIEVDVSPSPIPREKEGAVLCLLELAVLQAPVVFPSCPSQDVTWILIDTG